MKLNKGDSVRVRDGFIDEETDHPMGGWQGRVKELYPETAVAMVSFDSVTIKAMPASYIERCEEQGYGWSEYGFEVVELVQAEPRDKEPDVVTAIAEVGGDFEYSHLGAEGRAIDKILADVEPGDEMDALETWEAYLSKHLTFPFEAEVNEWQGRGPLRPGDRVKIHGLEMVDDHYGIIAKLKRGRESFHFPLCDLKALDPASPNHEPLQLYVVWFANR